MISGRNFGYDGTEVSVKFTCEVETVALGRILEMSDGYMKVIDVEVRSRLGELYWYNKRRTLQSV